MNEEDLKNLTLQELKDLVKEANTLIKEMELNNRKVVYQHNCFGSASYHLTKYKHWSKLITDVDVSKSNGYAFIGEFLKVNMKHQVPIGSLIVECCNNSLYLYKVVGDEEKEEIFASGYTNIIYFIRNCKDYLENN